MSHLPSRVTEPLRDEAALFAELDAIARECPELAADLGADLLELQTEFRGARATERPGANERWDR